VASPHFQSGERLFNVRTVILSNFTEKELAFLRTQRLGRLATVSPEGRPQIAPVMYQYNAALDTIEIGGANLNKSKKFRNILKTPY
jgi:pyridoxamine 5'-phosphate oxidase family protein